MPSRPRRPPRSAAAWTRPEWVDGKVTAGYQSAEVKRNRQLPEQHPLAQELGNLILQRLSANNLLMSAALPRKIFPPLFNRYEGGEAFGYRRQRGARAVRRVRARAHRSVGHAVLSEPDSYDGGELVIDDTYGPRGQAAGRTHGAISGTSLHKVNPVTRARASALSSGCRAWCARTASARAADYMDAAIQRLNQDAAGHPSIVQLTGIYHNLLRRWVDV